MRLHARDVTSRVVQVLPVVAFVATFGVFFVDKQREARTLLRSPRGLLVVGTIVAGYALVALVTKRLLRHRRWAPPVLLAGTVLGLAAWTVRPYYVDETANRTIVATQVDEVPEPAGAAPDQTAPSPEVTAPAGPVRLSNGDIVGIDHDARGTVSLIRAVDGTLVVRFEGFDIEGTPDPQLYLVSGNDVRDPGGTSLGRMPGNRGEILDVAVPAGVDAGPGWTVLVWCERFGVPIANATQAW